MSEQNTTIPQELTDKVKALKQLINVHDLLNQGQFPGHANKRIAEGLEFIAALHKQLLGEINEHPEFEANKTELMK